MIAGDLSWDRVLEIFKGDKFALELMQQVHHIAHIWDDIIDKDVPLADADVNRAFWYALVGMRRNPFYRQYYLIIDPMIDNAVMNYIASLDLEKGTKDERALAHVARCNVGDIAITIAGIIGGYEWAAQHAAELKAKSNVDPLDDYLKETEAKHGTAH